MQFILKENSFERRYTDYAATIDSEKIRGFDLLTLLSQRERDAFICKRFIVLWTIFFKNKF